jgi:hypothetical protein
MKIAILVSGEYRTFDICCNYLHLLTNPLFDIYFSTWDRSRQSCPRVGYYTDQQITPQHILNTLNRDATILILPHDLIKNPKKYNVKMLYLWLAGFNFIRSSGKKYDAVLLIRPDFISQNDQFSEISIDLNKFNITWADSWGATGLSDLCFGSSYELMDSLFMSISIDKWEQDEEQNWHIWWKNKVKNIFSDVNSLDPTFGLSLLCRPFSKRDHQFTDIVNITKDWADLTMLSNVDIGRASNQQLNFILQEKFMSGAYSKYYKKNKIEILLAGEFRTGKHCSSIWKDFATKHDAHITLLIDQHSFNEATENYPFSRIVLNDYNNKTTTRCMFERWKQFVNSTYLDNSQMLIISRPDVYIFDFSQIIKNIEGNSFSIAYDEGCTNDIIFAITFGLFTQIINEYVHFESNENDFKTHEYLYYAAKKNKATNTYYSASIYR